MDKPQHSDYMCWVLLKGVKPQRGHSTQASFQIRYLFEATCWGDCRWTTCLSCEVTSMQLLIQGANCLCWGIDYCIRRTRKLWLAACYQGKAVRFKEREGLPFVQTYLLLASNQGCKPGCIPSPSASHSRQWLRHVLEICQLQSAKKQHCDFNPSVRVR